MIKIFNFLVQHGVAASPAAPASVPTPSTTNVQSPASILNPGSVGPVASPLNPAEEQAYLEKVCLKIKLMFRAQKVPSGSPGQIDFLAKQVAFKTYLPNGQGSRQVKH